MRRDALRDRAVPWPRPPPFSTSSMTPCHFFSRRHDAGRRCAAGYDCLVPLLHSSASFAERTAAPRASRRTPPYMLRCRPSIIKNTFSPRCRASVLIDFREDDAPISICFSGARVGAAGEWPCAMAYYYMGERIKRQLATSFARGLARDGFAGLLSISTRRTTSLMPARFTTIYRARFSAPELQAVEISAARAPTSRR